MLILLLEFQGCAGSQETRPDRYNGGAPFGGILPMLRRIVSGGQTGVDRAALDAALDLGFPCGGWCPRGRRAEDGEIPERYPLTETTWHRYPQRTEWNVRDSDATLIITRGQPDGGTALTVELTQKHGRPCLVIDPGDVDPIGTIRRWLDQHRVQVLNVAGPRESSQEGIYALAFEVIHELLRTLEET
jgi:predicted Rossmann-fold nucleotide-binding protein